MKPLCDLDHLHPLFETPAGNASNGTRISTTPRALPALAISVALSLVLLSGCNSTDALTPQVDVGAGTFNSPPVTERDLDGMASQPPVTTGQQQAASQPVRQSEQPITGQTLAPPSSTTTTALHGGTAAGNGTYHDPAGTLEGQAAALGSQPAATQQQPVQQTVSEPVAAQPATGQQANQPPTQTAAVNPQAGALSVRFLPIIGAPVQAVTPLSRQLGADARAKGITIKSATDASAQHMLKGYFSAFADGPKTTVTYVWDVLDASGNRLNRIQGQETAPGGGADPWATVAPETMQAIASKTIESYLSWRNGR
ncbi:hypothetical protein SAMN05880582_1011292 [Rhizobium sp. RU20A]|uniref:hypothetical protein n=1 Tax=Rhizobium sp. RU20A TaxID=1907412 RepID=UPI000954A579|nr:hypothetical protein [Rhizobium sp. RU20A]SIQ26390.1 hypothetical protein SAMN05880582_1011292 [Rhizobium sp. RU20A]